MPHFPTEERFFRNPMVPYQEYKRIKYEPGKVVRIKNPWPNCCNEVTRPRSASGVMSWITEPEVVRKVAWANDINPTSSIAATTQLAWEKRMAKMELAAIAPRQMNPLLDWNPPEAMARAAMKPPSPVVDRRIPPMPGPPCSTSAVNTGSRNRTGWRIALGMKPSTMRLKITLSPFHTYLSPSFKLASGETLTVEALRKEYGVLMCQKANTVPAYNADSKTKFQKNPRVAIRKPPINGPIMRVPPIVNTLAATALTTYPLGTVFATNAGLMEWVTARHEPPMITYT